MNNADEFPRLRLARQQVDRQQEIPVESAVAREINKLGLANIIKPGQTVALTAGSRGIAQIAEILRATVHSLRSLGADPFVVPAMGSHGGGTADGQVSVLAEYGITEQAIQAPIRASMDVVEIGRHSLGGPIYIDRVASQADHIGIVARIKPHTGFNGTIESGLIKMMMIGLGKHEGAKEYHRILVRHPWEPFARSVASMVLDRVPIRFGLAIVENALDETAQIEGVRADEFFKREPVLLERARHHLPRLPVGEVDLLIIDQIGKDISGSGADTNVIGRKPTTDWNERDLRNSRPLVHRIFVRGLTSASHGNAAGIGLADFTTDRVVDQIDYRVTTINCLTANHPLAAAIPIHFPTDREVVRAALRTVGLVESRDARVVWITDTLRTAQLALSACYAGEATDPPVVWGDEFDWPFDDAGNLPLLTSLRR
ncbi:nickel-dependent lactate racemase [bacterium]|nr:nickel-dependent lactate racemase [bacterium]